MNDTYDDLIKQAEAHFEAGKYQEAIDSATQAIALDPQLPTAYTERGNAYEKKEDYDHAIEDYSEAIKLAPNNAVCYKDRGYIYNRKGEYDRAIEDYNAAIVIAPKDAYAFLWRGKVYEHKGECDRAVEDYNAAIVIAPENATAFLWRGQVYETKGEYDRAIEDYTNAIEFDSKMVYAFSWRGYIYGKKGEYDRAIKDYTDAIKLAPEDSYYYLRRGSAYHKKQEYDRAITDCTKAIEFSPKDAENYFCRGSAYFLKKEYDLALKDLDKIINLYPENANAYYCRGKTYCKKGEYGLAIVDYGKAVELRPNDLSLFQDNFLDHIKKHGDSLNYSVRKQLRDSTNYWVRLIGDILCDIGNKANYEKYINLILEVYKLQADVERKSQWSEKGRYFYQYTTRDVVEKIHKTHVLWLTPACYQNDPDEGKFVFEYLESTTICDTLKMLIRESQVEERFDQRVIAFIRAFNAGEDDLLMWNSSYAENGAGVALGVHSSKLSKANNLAATSGFMRETENRGLIKGEQVHATPDLKGYVPMNEIYFARVRYLSIGSQSTEKKDDSNDFKGVITALKAFTDRFFKAKDRKLKDKRKKDVIIFFPRIFMPISHLVKNATYDHEEEWRLLYFTTLKEGKEKERINWNPKEEKDEIKILHLETEPIFLTGKTPKEKLCLGPRIDPSELERIKIGHWFEYEMGDCVDIYMSKVHFRDTDVKKPSESPA